MNNTSEVGSEDGSELALKAKRKAGLARGDLFQDIIGGICMLSVLLGDSKAVKIEKPYDDDDRFDDVILETEEETICIQVKNGPDYRFTETDLNGGSGRLNVEKLVESAKSRRDGDAGSRFIVFTSYNAPQPSHVPLACDGSEFRLFGGLNFETQQLAGRPGTVSENTEIEFIFEVPGVELDEEEEAFQGLKTTKIFDHILAEVRPLFDDRVNPRIADSETLVERAISLAARAREDPGHRLTRDIIADRLEVLPSAQEIPQVFPVDEDCIIPDWIHDLRGSMVDGGERLLIEGEPGSGKSTGIELLHSSLEERDSFRTIRYNLFSPSDRPSEASDRIDPEWFRDQIAAQLRNKFPGAFDSDNTPVWTGTDDLQNHIHSVADWAKEHNQQGIVIIDGLDHALPNPEGMNTREDIEGTIVDEIGKLSIPEPLRLLLVGRELSKKAKQTLSVDNQEPVPTWQRTEIETYFEQNGVTVDSALLDSVYRVSNGLPVILSHLLRTGRSNPGSIEDGLRSAVADAPEVHGELREYYERIWEPVSPHSRDVLSLIAVSPTAMEAGFVYEILDLPWIQNKAELESGALAHTLERSDSDLYHIFHASFREFVIEELSTNEKEEIHESLYKFYFEKSTASPSYQTRLRYHAEHGPGLEHLRGLASQDNILRWWREGAHISEITESLELAFEGAVEAGDYATVFYCTILGATTHSMLSVYVDDRLEYYIALGDGNKALRFLEQTRENSPGSGAVLDAMQSIALSWPEKLDPGWLEEWFENNQGSDQSFDWKPEAYFDTAARILPPDDFWRHASGIVSGESEDQFTYQVFKGVRENPVHLQERPEPPEWLFDDLTKALEACETIGSQLPAKWQHRFLEELSTYNDLSAPALHTVLKCGADEAKVKQSLDLIQFGDVRSINEDYPRFSEAYYVGATLADLGFTPEALLTEVDDLAKEQPRIRQLVAIIGAATTREASTETTNWTDATLTFIRDLLEKRQLGSPEPENFARNQYRTLLRKTTHEFVEVVDEGTDELIDDVVDIADPERYQPYLLSKLAEDMRRVSDAHHPEDQHISMWEERYSDLMRGQPSGEPPSRELMDLAIRAADSNEMGYAEKYFEKAIERGFRYGYHKDILLSDIWEGLLHVVEDDWESHEGTAIQLINWANLLHQITDGDETSHLEYDFLSTLLDENAVDYHSVAHTVRETGTARRLRKWRLRNPDGITKEELEEIIQIREWKLRARPHATQDIRYFADAALIAADQEWDSTVKLALRCMNRGERVGNGVDKEKADEIRELAETFDVRIPEDIVSVEDSDDYGKNESQRPPGLAEKLHKTLAAHEFEDPISTEEFDEFSPSELEDAGKAVIQTRQYNPSVVAPIAEKLVEHGMEDIASSLIVGSIAECRLLTWSWYGHGRFEMVCEVLLDIEGEDALKLVLNAWQSSDLDSRTNQCIFPQLVWIVKHTRGQVAAEELIDQSVHWLRELLKPHENEVQHWGAIESPPSD